MCVHVMKFKFMKSKTTSKVNAVYPTVYRYLRSHLLLKISLAIGNISLNMKQSQDQMPMDDLLSYYISFGLIHFQKKKKQIYAAKFTRCCDKSHTCIGWERGKIDLSLGNMCSLYSCLLHRSAMMRIF